MSCLRSKSIIGLLTFLLLGISPNIFSNSTIDSLKARIDTTVFDTVEIHSIVELSNSYWYSAPDSAIYFANIALDRIQELLPKKTYKGSFMKDRSSAYNSMGVAYYVKGNYTRSLVNFENSKNEALQINDTGRIASAYNNLGIIQNKLKNYDEAKKSYEKALSVFKELGNMEQAAKAIQNIANVYYKKKEYSEALRLYNECYAIFDSIENEGGKVINNYNIGHTLLSLKEFDKARETLDSSIVFAKQLENKLLVAMHHVSLGEIDLKRLKYEEAKLEFSEAEQLFSEIGATSRLPGVFKGLSEAYENLGDVKKSLSYYKKYNELDDSLLAGEKIEEIATMRMQFDFDREKAEDSIAYAQKEFQSKLLLEKETVALKAKRKQQVYLIIGLILLAIFGVFMFNRFRVTARQKEIIDRQRLMVEEQRDEVSHQKIQIEKQHEELEEIHKEISDSIKYAERLQLAILPPVEDLRNNLKNGFVLFLPKDVVSGDFYWMQKVGDQILYAAADCTGHGVPGAMVSVVCSNALNRSVKEFGFLDPSKILDKTRELVIETFARSGKNVKDGMDIALCSKEGNKLTFAGANNPLWVMRAEEYISEEQKEERSTVIGENGYGIIELKASKQPVGLYEGMKPFEQTEIELYEGDSLFIFTDGYADQFGGKKNKKLMYKPFKKLLLSIRTLEMDDQKTHLANFFEEWRGKNEQIDDVCVIGVRI